MMLEMVERVSEDFVVDTILILVRLVSLLPAKVQEQVLLVIDFLPLFSGRENAADERAVIAGAEVILVSGLNGVQGSGVGFFLFCEG